MHFASIWIGASLDGWHFARFVTHCVPLFLHPLPGYLTRFPTCRCIWNTRLRRKWLCDSVQSWQQNFFFLSRFMRKKKITQIYTIVMWMFTTNEARFEGYTVQMNDDDDWRIDSNNNPNCWEFQFSLTRRLDRRREGERERDHWGSSRFSPRILHMKQCRCTILQIQPISAEYSANTSESFEVARSSNCALFAICLCDWWWTFHHF